MNFNLTNLQNAPEITDFQIEKALKIALRQTENCLDTFSSQFKNIYSCNHFYSTAPNNQWTNGFWTGELWLAYENSGKERFRNAALTQVQSFLNRIEQGIETDTHDLGFLYSLSCVAGYKLTGNETAKKAAILAAQKLAARFREKGQFIQAWGPLDGKDNYRLIIDCLLNLPLLYWASEETKDPIYGALAQAHFDTALRVVVRPDSSTYHTYYFDRETGEPLYGATHQGYSAQSVWSRGQAWGVYGIALSFRYTKKSACLQLFDQVTEYFINHLPQNLIPYWDFTFTDGSNEPRDSSALAITICGLLEMADLLPDHHSSKDAYIRTARQLMKPLVELCSVKSPEESNGQLLHGVYGRKTPYNDCIDHGINECNLWGDYYYVEALTRLSKKWTPYW